ncbi:MAG: NAD(P)H-dependent oxidoreductase [Actinobacteria bacterium]|nr:NAD(P)H-dependent oxidoreductase [Actinomycetota bacterium]
MARLLVVHHSPTRGVRTLTEAVLAGAHDDAITGVEVVVRPALEATAQDVLDADGYLLGTPANFGYMSGALKHFFDSTFLQIGGALSRSGSPDDSAGGTHGAPFGLYVHGRYDTTGALRSVTSIVGALGWRQSAEVLEVMGEVTGQDEEAAYELGGTLAALLSERPTRRELADRVRSRTAVTADLDPVAAVRAERDSR